MREHLHAREQLLQVGGDDVLQRDVPLRGGLQEAGQQRRHLDAGEVAVAADRVADDHGEVQREARDVREGVRRVDGQRGQDREDLLAEEGEQAGLLLLRELGPADQVDALVGECRGDVLLVAGGVPGHELAGAGPDQVQHLAGLQAGGGAGGDAGRDTALQSGHPDHEELVQVARRRSRGSSPVRAAGVAGSSASSSTRSLNASQLRSRSRNRPWGSSAPVRPASSYASRSASMSGSRSETAADDRVRAVRGDGAYGRLGVLDRYLGGLLAHGPILPREGVIGRVGAGLGRQRTPVSRGGGHSGLHSPRVARVAECPVTRT